jgi:hypothetical protein
MAITTLSQYEKAKFTRGIYRTRVSKAISTTGQSNQPVSYWTPTGTPAVGGVPLTTAAVCSSGTVGALPLPTKNSNESMYLYGMTGTSSNANSNFELHDRLMHVGGYSGTSTSFQAFPINLSANLGTANLAARIGKSDYSEVSWWLEWYIATGATVTTATILYEADGLVGDDNFSLSVPASRPSGCLINLNNSLFNAAGEQRYIKKINSILLATSTGTIGNFGITATRLIGVTNSWNNNTLKTADMFQNAHQKIEDQSCLFALASATNNTTNTINLAVEMVVG